MRATALSFVAGMGAVLAVVFTPADAARPLHDEVLTHVLAKVGEYEINIPPECAQVGVLAALRWFSEEQYLGEEKNLNLLLAAMLYVLMDMAPCLQKHGVI